MLLHFKPKDLMTTEIFHKQTALGNGDNKAFGHTHAGKLGVGGIRFNGFVITGQQCSAVAYL